jgi:hypothetical protein
MPQNPMIAEARKMHQRLRDALRTGKSIPVAMGDPSHSFRTIPLRVRAKQAGVDDNDPLLVRALELQEKATDFRTNPILWLDMEDAVLDFLEAHFELRNPFPPQWERIEELIRKLERGTATAIEKEEFRRLANEILQNPEYSNFKKRLDPAMSLLDNSPSDSDTPTRNS